MNVITFQVFHILVSAFQENKKYSILKESANPLFILMYNNNIYKHFCYGRFQIVQSLQIVFPSQIRTVSLELSMGPYKNKISQ
jgi:hypothetical protein